MIKCKRRKPIVRRTADRREPFRHWHEITPIEEDDYRPKILKEWPVLARFEQENIEVGYL